VLAPHRWAQIDTSFLSGGDWTFVADVDPPDEDRGGREHPASGGPFAREPH
jgi:hypothetical protein